MKRRVLGLGLVVLAALIVGGVWLVVQTQPAAPIVPLTPEGSEEFDVITPENIAALSRLHKIRYVEGYDPREPRHSMVYSPDSRLIAVLGQGEGFSMRVGLWDVETGAVIRWHQVKEYGTEHLAFSPNGRWLVGYPTYQHTLGDVWNVQTGEALSIAAYYDEHEIYIYSPVIFLPSSELMVSNYQEKTLDIWNLETVTHRTIPIDIEVDSFRRAEDDKHIYINDELWSIETWQPVETTPTSEVIPEWHEKLCENSYDDELSYSPDGNYLIRLCYSETFSPSSMQYWDAHTGQLIRHLAEDVGYPRYSADGRLFAGSSFWRVGFYDSANALLLRDFINVETHVRSSMFSPDGRTFAVTDTLNLYLFAVSDTPQRGCPIGDTSASTISLDNVNHLMLLRQMGEPLTIGDNLTFSDDGRYLLETNDIFLRVWDVKTQETIFFSDDDAVRTQQPLSFTYTQLIDGVPTVIDANVNYDFTQRFIFHNYTADTKHHYEIKEDYYSRSVVNSENGNIWEMEVTGSLLTLSPNGRLVVTSTDAYFYHLSLWQHNEYETTQDDEPFYDVRTEWRYSEAAFSPDGRYIALIGYIPVTDSGYSAIHIWGICEP